MEKSTNTSLISSVGCSQNPDNLSPKLCKDAHEVIMEFIRSRPTLKPVSLPHLLEVADGRLLAKFRFYCYAKKFQNVGFPKRATVNGLCLNVSDLQKRIQNLKKL